MSVWDKADIIKCIGLNWRISLSMSDPDLVPLLIQRVKRMNLIACAAELIADGDLVNVQIRRYRQWQLSQTSSVASCIIPASLLHGQREILEQVKVVCLVQAIVICLASPYSFCAFLSPQNNWAQCLGKWHLFSTLNQLSIYYFYSSASYDQHELQEFLVSSEF
ncbi:hypothetical protein HN51_027765 [Arachis hypogaea]